jgi:hypothetical protein
MARELADRRSENILQNKKVYLRTYFKIWFSPLRKQRTFPLNKVMLLMILKKIIANIIYERNSCFFPFPFCEFLVVFCRGDSGLLEYDFRRFKGV